MHRGNVLCPLQVPVLVSGDFNVNLVLFPCFGAIKIKYFGKHHFVGTKQNKKKFDLGLF